MRKSRFVLWVIVPFASCTPRPLAIFTNYPSQVVGLGETAALPLAQSVLLIWPQLTCLIAATILLFAQAYLLFQRQEIRA